MFPTFSWKLTIIFHFRSGPKWVENLPDAVMRKPFAHPQGRSPVQWPWGRRLAFATFSLAAVLPLRADNTNLTDEVRLLREENALLQQQVKRQSAQLDTLTQK
jgi:hypothetical protein